MTSRREFLFGTAAVAATLSAPAATRPPLQPPPDRFLARLRQLMEVSGTPGLAAVVIERGRVVWEHYAGVLKADESEPVTPETVWPAASLGKPRFVTMFSTTPQRSFDRFTSEDVRTAVSEMPNVPVPMPSVMVPNVAGGLLTTARDYAKFLVATLDLTGARLTLSHVERTAMTTSQVTLNSAMGWGLGWGLETASGTMWHWGDNGGWKNVAIGEPHDMSALVVFTNSSHGMNVAERFVIAATGQDHVAFQWL